jgi:hypothetical protein
MHSERKLRDWRSSITRTPYSRENLPLNPRQGWNSAPSALLHPWLRGSPPYGLLQRSLNSSKRSGDWGSRGWSGAPFAPHNPRRPMLATRAVLPTLLAVLLLFLGSTSVWAQEPTAGEVESLTISLLPQYDDPRLLIIYEAVLPQPGEVAMGVPPGVELHTAAYRAADGTLRSTEARWDAASTGRYIRFSAPTREVRLELYQDVVPRQTDRFVDFTLPRQLFDVARLRWVVVFPLDSTEIVTEPPMERYGLNHIGMEEYHREAGRLPVGERALQTIEWARESNEPSIILPDDPPAAADPTMGDLHPVYVGAGLAFLVGLALVLNGLWRQRRPV